MAASIENVQVYFTKGDGDHKAMQSSRSNRTNRTPNRTIHASTKHSEQYRPNTTEQRVGNLDDSVKQWDVYSTDFSKPVRPTIKRQHINPNTFDYERVERSKSGVYDESAIAKDNEGDLPQNWVLQMQSKLAIGYGICTTIATLIFADLIITKSGCWNQTGCPSKMSSITSLPLFPTATSSSVHHDEKFHIAQYAIDGQISSSNSEYFRSKEEHFPWCMIDLRKSYTISGFNLTGPGGTQNTIIQGLSNKLIEIRVGPTDITEMGQKIAANSVCGNKTLNGSLKEEITINCAKPVYGRYITIQMINPNEEYFLMINEINWNTINAQRPPKSTDLPVVIPDGAEEVALVKPQILKSKGKPAQL